MAKSKEPEIISITAGELEELLTQLQVLLPAEIFEKVHGLLRTLQVVMEKIQRKTTSLARLYRMFFGPKTEKADKLFPKDSKDPKQSAAKDKKKREGHGRKKAADYPGAKVVPILHPLLNAGSLCLECLKGKVRELTPVRLIRITAQPMISALKFEMQRLRCNLCGAVFTAPAPPEAAQGKYDPSVGVQLGLSRYGMGVPMYRTEKWQQCFGVPMPASNQWELIKEVSPGPKAVYEALKVQAAQGRLIHSDDTNMRIQELARQRAEADAADKTKDKRTGSFTTGMVAKTDQHEVALFMTGAKHAGENLDEVLKNRAAELGKPLHMSDGLSRNESKEFETIICNCLAHGRRAFVDVKENFPEECRYVIESLRQVYRFDARAKEKQLSDADRLAFHQEHSQPVMDQLKDWMSQQFDQKKVEPNSGLGQAIQYMLKRWEALTRFLTVAGAPLDNNICERALKRAILHRKNSMSYKTLNGAEVGDTFMSLIHTCSLNGINPFDYFMALHNNAQAVLQAPDQWFPWNYRATQEPIQPPNTS